MKKMTENEIIERLEALVKNGFPFCADALNLIKHLKELDKKNENIIRLADKTIESQSAEIEKKYIEIDILIRKKEALKDEVEQWKEEANKYQNLWCEVVKDIQTAKSEAIKEFAERLKEMEKICILKCKEKDLLHNVKILCTENLEYLPGFPGLFCKGNRFYFILKNYEDLKDVDIRGKIIK